MRYLLAVLLFAICAALGTAKSSALKRRQTAITALIDDITALKTHMEYRMLPLDELLMQEYRMNIFAAFAAALKRMDNAETALLFAESAERESGLFSDLGKEESEVLHMLLLSFGTADIASQTGMICEAEDRLSKCLTTAASEAEGRGRVYGQIGVLSGLLAAVLVI